MLSQCILERKIRRVEIGGLKSADVTISVVQSDLSENMKATVNLSFQRQLTHQFITFSIRTETLRGSSRAGK